MRKLISGAAAAVRDWRRRADASTRAQFHAFRDGLAFRRSARAWDDANRRAWMLERLRGQARFAVQQFDFWRDRFHAAGIRQPDRLRPEELCALPPLERDDLPPLFAEAQAKAGSMPAKIVRTGGSTGVPAEILKGPLELGWSESAPAFFRAQLGLPRTPRTAFVWGHHLDPITRATRRERLDDFLFQQLWVDIFRIDEESLRSADRVLERFAPELIIAYASSLDAMAAAVNPDGRQRRPYPTRAIITGAEKLLPAYRERISRTFAAPVYEQYGGRDVGLLAHQLDPAGGPLTVDWAQMYLEPEREEVEAPILLTKLHADAMPVFRYRVGDLARFPEGSRPGAAALTLREVIGREMNMLWRPDGSRVSGIFFAHLFKDFPLREFQVRQDESFDVTVLLVPREEFSDAHERALETTLSENLAGCSLTIRRVNEVPRGANRKLHPVIAPARLPGSTTR